jgi:membrane-associated protein
MQIIRYLIDFVLHIDVHLGELISVYGTLVYIFLFLIIFVETGLVVTPFLPGDSLIFAAGTFAAIGSLNPILLFVLLAAAAILGDTANYWIGHFFGERLIANPKIPIKKEHIDKTNAFFDKYGGKTIFLARFVPFVRTFAPFVAGIGKMHYGQFILYNFFGGVVWVALFTFLGYFFGNVPIVKHNFSIVIIAIVIISVIPAFFEAFRNRRTKKTS